MKFFKCKHCGNFIVSIYDSGVAMICCGEEMQELKANTTDGAFEKHVPAVEINGNEVLVKVGSVEHPMLPAHHIDWLILETTNGYQKQDLKQDGKPEAKFVLAAGEKVVAAYEYCNLHGLWKKEL